MGEVEDVRVRLEQEVAQIKLFRQATGNAFNEDRAPTAYGREILENTSRGMELTNTLLQLMAICVHPEPQESRSAAGAGEIQEHMLAQFDSMASITVTIAELLGKAREIEQGLMAELTTLEQMREHTMESLRAETEARRHTLDFL